MSPSDASGHSGGRCYCGALRVSLTAAPQTVAYCHCADCRRWTGAPVAAFAAMAVDALRVDPPLGAGFSAVQGVHRWNCPHCGSPIAATFDYLPEQIYVPLGLLDDAAAMPPALHCHNDSRLPWLHLTDGLPRQTASGRASLRRTGQ